MIMRLVILQALSAISICCYAAVTPDVIHTPLTYRQIPKKVVLASLSGRSTDQDLIDDVYEISDDGMLIGKNTTVDLTTEARPISGFDDTTPFDFVVNGEKRSSAEVNSVVVHEVNGLEVMYDDNDRVSAVWGDDLFLVQLDAARFPGVYINIKTMHSSLGDLKAFDEKDVTTLASGSKPVSLDNASKQNGRCRTVEVAVAHDNTYCARFGQRNARNAGMAIRRIVDLANARFRQDTCHQLQISRIEAHCDDPNDPYDYRRDIAALPANSNRASFILDSFRNFWTANRGDVNRDVAYLLTGYEDNTGVAGVAYVGAACTNFGYGWVEGNGPGIFIHEMGHSLGCDHSSAGIMRPTLIDPNAQFSSFSVGQMNSFLSTSRANCIA